MPRHNFNCGKCNESNTIDVSPQCGCHECEGRRPQNNHYKMMTNLVRCVAVIAAIGLMMIPSGCYINGHFEQLRTEASQKAANVAAQQNRDSEEAKRKAISDAELQKIEAIKSLNLDKFDVKSTITGDGKVAVILVPKDK